MRVPRRRGFTLVEMLTTLSVLAVTLALAAPSLGGIMRNGRLRTAQSDLVASLMLARTEAARRGARVGVQAKADAATGGLARGWWVWVDSDNDGLVGAREPRLRDVASPGSGVVIAGRNGATGAVFSPRGFLVSMSAACFDIYSVAPGERGSYRLQLQPVGLADVQEDAKCS